ncbi:MAG: ribosomal protein L7/L12 [Chloroflexi bacterium]|nr:ribosomal protein L7/L12 [Chloroflexota bacterium]MCI0577218.1 ribosomal protein L7/L12 [Chloroflexota bacterium]MCI0647509.1 ribosomal protein L7/L12 [Chloroflexota bacterium]MCI0729141.1 ribosomal protein L7/L12 [Chloroflexota bacterium]
MDEHERVSTLMKQVYQLERKVDFLLKHLNLEYQEEPDLTVRPQVEALLRQGKQIEAIKLFRTVTGLGLREAKDAVDKIEREMRGKW